MEQAENFVGMAGVSIHMTLASLVIANLASAAHPLLQALQYRLSFIRSRKYLAQLREVMPIRVGWRDAHSAQTRNCSNVYQGFSLQYMPIVKPSLCAPAFLLRVHAIDEHCFIPVVAFFCLGSVVEIMSINVHGFLPGGFVECGVFSRHRGKAVACISQLIHT